MILVFGCQNAKQEKKNNSQEELEKKNESQEELEKMQKDFISEWVKKENEEQERMNQILEIVKFERKINPKFEDYLEVTFKNKSNKLIADAQIGYSKVWFEYYQLNIKPSQIKSIAVFIFFEDETKKFFLEPKIYKIRFQDGSYEEVSR